MRGLFTYLFILSLSFAYSQDTIWTMHNDTTVMEITGGQYGTVNYDTLLNTESNKFIFSKYDTVIDAAKEFDGVRYAYGGMDHNGMDCSGLVCTAFERVNHRLPHSSKQLAKMGVEVEADYLEKGDLIFFSGRTNKSISHVAIVSKIEDGLIHIVHATSSRGVMEEVLQNNSYFMQRWLFNRRIE